MAKLSHMVLPVSDTHKSRDWYVGKLGFTIEREHEEAVGIKDESGLTIFLIKTTASLTGKNHAHESGGQGGNQDEELARLGIKFVSPPKRQFWGYGAEVRDTQTGT